MMKTKSILVLLMILLSVSIHGFELKKVLEFGSDLQEEYIIFKRGPITVDHQGNIYAVDSETQEIRKYDKMGRFMGKAGRKGQGPGEFLGITSMAIQGESLLVMDLGNRRLSRFSLDLEYLQSETAHLSFSIASIGDYLLAEKRIYNNSKLVLLKPFTETEKDIQGAASLKVMEKHKDSLFLWVYFRNMFAVEENTGAFVATLHYPLEDGPELLFFSNKGEFVRRIQVASVVPGYKFDERRLYRESMSQSRRDAIVIRNIFYINEDMISLQCQYHHGNEEKFTDNFLLFVDSSNGRHLGKHTLGKELDFFCFKGNKLYGFSFDNEEAEVMIQAYELVTKKAGQ